MISQNKSFSFKIKRQAKNVFPRDVDRTVSMIWIYTANLIFFLFPASSVSLDELSIKNIQMNGLSDEYFSEFKRFEK